MIRIPGIIPIAIFPSFWIVAALLGLLLSGGDFAMMFIWIGIIFFSVLIHEFGHALTAKCFGMNPRIELVAMGGLTYHQGEKLPWWKQFLITLNGPIFGFLLAIAAYLLLQIPSLSQGYPGLILHSTQWVNLVWTVVNLVPVMPLDGGQLMRVTLESIFKVKGMRYSLVVSMIIALTISLFFFVTQNFWAGAIFFLFAFENFDAYRRTSNLRESDRNEGLKQAIMDAESLFKSGNKEDALKAFEKIRAASKEGMIYLAATQFAAMLNYEIGKRKEAYEELVPLKDKLDPEGICLLHRLAFEEGDYRVVTELAGTVFQLMPEAETALRNAYACANLSQAEATVGWLQTAFQSGVENLKEIVSEKTFDPIRTHPEFQAFSSSL